MATWNAPQIPPTRPRARTLFWNYPRPYRTGWKAWLPSWRFIIGVMLAGTSLVAGVVIAAWMNITIDGEVANASIETSIVKYAGKGGTLGEFKAEEDRKIVTVDDLPIWVANAPVASEDRDFYAANNLGISPTGIVRAAITGTGGGSTLTQQYVEQYLMGWNPSPTYADKFTEMIMAMKVRQDEDYPPEKILDGYLNVINLGRSSFGIQSAAQSYYGKNAKDLTPSESAFLAGIIPSPNSYDETEWGPDWAEGRWGRTLSLMHADGYINDEQYDEAVDAGFPTPKERKASSAWGGPKGYILREIERELQGQDFDISRLSTDGLEIHTTLNKKLQNAAAKAAKLPEDANTPHARSSLVSIDPASGAIRAMYGGPDYADPVYSKNAATDEWLQGGSTFKPFTLIAALDQGIPLGTRYNGNDSQTFDYYTDKVDGVEVPKPVTNFDNYNPGEIDLLQSTIHSVNASYVQLNHEATPQASQRVAKELGLDVEGSIAYSKWNALSDEEKESRPSPGETSAQVSNVLGTSSVYAVDLARAYATIANGGVRTTPHLVDKIVDPDTGKTVYEADFPGENAEIDPEAIAAATFAMSQVVDDPQGSGHFVRSMIPDRPIAGKTGTSNDNRSAWFAGFTPQLATVVGVYEWNQESQVIDRITAFGGFEAITGGSWPVQAWTTYMATATEGMPIEQFPEYTFEPLPSPTPTQSEEPETVTVPTGLEGKSWNEVRKALTDIGLNPQPQDVESELPPGTVITVQNAGQEVPALSTITVERSRGPGQNMSPVPSVVQMDQRQAESTLRSAGFGVNVQTQPSDQPEGTVVQQDPGPGAQAQRGSDVTIWVSDGSLAVEPDPTATCGIFQRDPCDEPTDGASEEPGPGGGGNGNNSDGG
ncbi:transglycosylase domain-containing protein [Myceligenerans halotolerans]